MNRSALINAVRQIKPGISDSSTVETSNLVLFQENHLVSFNDEVAVSVPFEIGIEAGVPAEELLKLLNKMTDDKINVSLEDNNVIISDKKTEAGFAVSAETEVADIGLDEITEWYPLPEDFTTALNFCVFSAATDISRGVLTCLNVVGNTVSSCDNFRLTKYEMQDEIEDIPLLVPRKAVPAIVDAMPIEFCTTGKQDNWIHFQNEEGIIFSVRQMSGEFPDVDHLLDVEGDEIKLPEDLKDALERTEILASTTDSGGKSVEIKVTKTKIVCRGESDTGWVEESTKIKGYKGPDLHLIVDPRMIAQILDHVDVVTVGDKMLFEGDNFRHVIALLDDDEEEEKPEKEEKPKEKPKVTRPRRRE